MERIEVVPPARAAPKEEPVLREVDFPLSGLLVLAAIAFLAVGQGGFYLLPRIVAGILLAAAGLATAWRWRPGSAGPIRWVLTALGGVGLISFVIGIADHDLLDALGQDLALAGLGVTMTAVAAQNGSERRTTVDALLGIGSLLGLSAWLGVAFHISPLGHADGGLWRAATTITYANASAAVLSILGCLALARRVDPDASRVATDLATFCILSGLGLTLSRAGLGAFVGGLVVAGALAGFGKVLRAGLRPAMAAALVVVGCVPGMPSPGPAKPVWALLGLVAGCAVALVRWSPERISRRRRRLGQLVAMAVLVAGVAGVSLVLADHWGSLSGRAGLDSPDRSAAAHAALQIWDHHLVTGVGPGKALLIWTEPPHRLVLDHYAHDEYLQFGAEDGLIGIAGLAVLVAAVIDLIRRNRQSRSGGEHHMGELGGAPGFVSAMAAGAVVAFLVHSGFDFLWHVAVVPVVAAVAIGLMTPDNGVGGKQVLGPERTEHT